MWDLHDRIESEINECTCKLEIESTLANGQLVPVLGRRLTNNPDCDVELIYGARRLFVARYLKRELLVDLRDIDDIDAIVAMDIENRHRMDISPYERGLNYLRLLRRGYFSSQDGIARTLSISASQVSRLVKIAQLPSVIVEAFGSPQAIRETWGLKLAEAIENPTRRTWICARARTLVSVTPRLTARDVYFDLLNTSAYQRNKKLRAADEIVLGRNGKPLFRIRHNRGTLILILPRERVSQWQSEEIRKAVLHMLEQDDGFGLRSGTALQSRLTGS